MDQAAVNRIALNTTALLSPKTGIGRYILELAQRLSDMPEWDASFFYGAFWSKDVRGQTPPTVAGLLPAVRRYLPYSYELRRWVQCHRFQHHNEGGHFALYHEPNNVPLPFDGPLVLTVHDLSWIRYPAMHPTERVRAMNRHFEPGLRRATRIITDSQCVKDELAAQFGVNPELIHPIALGASAAFVPRAAEDTWAVLQSHQLTHGRYILALGTLEPRKNLGVAIAAYSQLPARLQEQFPLVIVGMTGWLSESIERLIGPLRAKGLIRQLGFLPEDDLPQVVAGATCMVYPSVYEGFGLPPLEAMACGVPVITSNAAAVAEVVGDAGMLMHPQDTDAFAQTMQHLLDNPEARDAQAAQGLQRSAVFSWERCAEQTRNVYRLAAI